jgi:hypothetical protein
MVSYQFISFMIKAGAMAFALLVYDLLIAIQGGSD